MCATRKTRQASYTPVLSPSLTQATLLMTSETCFSLTRTSRTLAQGPLLTRSLVNEANCTLGRQARICLPDSMSTRPMDDEEIMTSHYHTLTPMKQITSSNGSRHNSSALSNGTLDKRVPQDIGFSISDFWHPILSNRSPIPTDTNSQA